MNKNTPSIYREAEVQRQAIDQRDRKINKSARLPDIRIGFHDCVVAALFQALRKRLF